MGIVHCRICGGAIDRQKEKENEVWIMPSKNYYYHKTCYETFRRAKPEIDDDWCAYIYDFLSRDLKVKYNFFLCEQQRQKFTNPKGQGKRYTNKGIYLSLKYFYEIQHNDWSKSNGGIGIIPFIYDDAAAYWAKRWEIDNSIFEKLKQQMQEKASEKTVIVHRNKNSKRHKQLCSLEEIGGMDDE